MDTQGGRRGRPPHPDILTPAEWHVLEHLRNGLTNAEIAVELGISPDGVKYHVSNMLAKLDLPDRHALAKWKSPRGGVFGRLSMKGILFGLAGLCGVAAVGATIVAATGALGSASSSAESNLPDIHSTLAIRSFQLTQKSVFDARIPLPNGSAPPPLPPGGATDTMTVYFRSPGQLRQEQTDTTIDGATGQRQTQPSVSLSKASDYWYWTPGSTDVQHSSDPPALADEFNYLYPKKGMSLRTLVAKMADGASAHMAGEGTVAGRPAYIVDIDPGPCSTKAADINGRRRVWFDKETLFPLKSELYSAADGRLTVSTDVTAIRYNQPLADNLFELPAGASVHQAGCGLPTPTPGGTAVSGDPCTALRAEEYADAQATATACATPTERPAIPNPSTAASTLQDIRSTVAIATYELTETTYTAPELLSPPPSLGHSAAPTSLQRDGFRQTLQVYFEAPDKVRIDTTSNSGSPKFELDHGGSVLNWTQDSGGALKFSDPFGHTNLAVDNHASWPALGTTLAELMNTLAPGRQVTLAGSDIVAGRPAYVVDASAAPCPSGVPWIDGPERFWLDKQTLFVLKSDQYMSDNHAQVASSTQVTSISYNLPLDANLFAPPKGMTVADINPLGNCGTISATSTPAASATPTQRIQVIQQQCGSAVQWMGTDAGGSCPSPIPVSTTVAIMGN